MEAIFFFFRSRQKPPLSAVGKHFSANCGLKRRRRRKEKKKKKRKREERYRSSDNADFWRPEKQRFPKEDAGVRQLPVQASTFVVSCKIRLVASVPCLQRITCAQMTLQRDGIARFFFMYTCKYLYDKDGTTEISNLRISVSSFLKQSRKSQAFFSMKSAQLNRNSIDL
ncbi:hypothetical protein CEXT_625631 [Caerostris extrusa]|uniref:Uncharacterized protein n=1 Tax=Caerostris extrusa TaxID=172846 RepID=A0AAV4XKN6_CAEEX|nr:hypothetical protein CEXT_625631 [Caerostris extrusa]